jgi:hypothetical protein
VLTFAHDIQITDRDLGFLRGLFESRVMTLAHAAALHFGGSLEAAKKRTQRLKGTRYIRERPRSRPYDPSILSLARRGFEALRRAGQLADYPALGWESMEKRAQVSPFTLRHELDVLSSKAAIVAALRGEALPRRAIQYLAAPLCLPHPSADRRRLWTKRHYASGRIHTD